MLSAAEVADLVATQEALESGTPPKAKAPTAEQRAVVEAGLHPALVVAGAGSGKTETMASRVVYLLANGLVEPDRVLGLTFTRKAAGELAERVRSRLATLLRAARRTRVELPGAEALLVGGGSLGPLAWPTVATYNSYAAGLVADHGVRLGVEPSSRVLGEAAAWQLASEVVETWAELDVDAAASTVTAAVLALSGALSEHLLEPGEAQRQIERIVAEIGATPLSSRAKDLTADVREVVVRLADRVRLLDLVAAYRERKRAADAIDFGDQVALAARLARAVPEVRAGERARYAVVLLDEYQDTSYAQVELLRALFGDGHPVTAVGDPHQSIYGWRGASAGGLERFPAQFPVAGGAPATVFTLSTSWRNDLAILDAANATSAPLRASATAVDLPVLAPRPGVGPGDATALVVDTVDDEAEAVAEWVAARWRPGGPEAPDGSSEGRVTAAVLCRKRAQFPLLHRALEARGVRVEVVGLGGLLDTPEVADVVAALTAAHDPSRGDALMRLLTGARTRLGAADLHALAAWSAELAARHAPGGRGHGRVVDDVVTEADAVDERSLVDALDELPRPGWRSVDGRTLTDEGRRRSERLAGLLRTVRSLTWLPLPELVEQTERLLGVDIEVAARPDRSPAQARVHLDALRGVAVEFAQATDQPTLGAFLAWLGTAEAHERGVDMPVAPLDRAAVQLITVHGAKGLEWDVVAVPGLIDGTFPSVKTTAANGPSDKAWLTDRSALPFPLRGDRDDLPVFEYSGAADSTDLEARRKRFVAAAGEHELAEERRLAYVAFTRPRTDLLLTAAWWGEGKTRAEISPFLTDLVEEGLARVVGWTDEPEAGATNPRAEHPVTARWPADPFGGSERRPAVEAAAGVVRAALASSADLRAPDDGAAEPGSWADTAARLLLERRRAATPPDHVEMPAHLSASALVHLDADPGGFALGLRRPVPAEPSRQARRGTTFHAWVEGFFGRASLVDVDDLPGADDDSAPVDLDQQALRESFLASEWAGRVPVAVETDVETPVAGYVLRCRMDAVFEDPERPGGAVVVDWKTGAPPTDAAQRAARELQLAAYRLAWSRWKGLPLADVRAAFCYVGAGVTVYPERLLDADEVEVLLRSVAGEVGA